MRPVISRILALMGHDRETGAHALVSEVEVARRLGLDPGDVEIALGMMAEEGLLERVEAGGHAALRLSARGEERYRREAAGD